MYWNSFVKMNTKIMNDTAVNWEDFYKHLGYLYFGIAVCDGNASEDNIQALRKSVDRIWKREASHLTQFQGYTPNKVESLFDWLSLNETGYDFCFDAFETHYNPLKDSLTEPMRTFVAHSAKEVAQACGVLDSPQFLKIQKGLL